MRRRGVFLTQDKAMMMFRQLYKRKRVTRDTGPEKVHVSEKQKEAKKKEQEEESRVLSVHETVILHSTEFPSSMQIPEPQPVLQWPPITKPEYSEIYKEVVSRWCPGERLCDTLHVPNREQFVKLVSDSVMLDWIELTRQRYTRACPTSYTGEHSEIKERTDFSRQPSSAYFTQSYPIVSGRDYVYCTCAENNTILMCNNLSHAHCVHSVHIRSRSTHQCMDRQVCGQDNQNIVATGTFGNDTRRRWAHLLSTSRSFDKPVHSIDLFNELERNMAIDEDLKGLRFCMASFSHRSRSEAVLGHPSDKTLSLLPVTKKSFPKANSVRDAMYMDSYHPHHDRIDARNANQVTMAILLFVEATGSSLWNRVWKIWRTLLLEHCDRCMSCKSACLEFMSLLCVMNFASRGVFPKRFTSNVENLTIALIR